MFYPTVLRDLEASAGFEPAVAVLQTASLTTCRRCLVGTAGLEPAAHARFKLAACTCSATSPGATAGSRTRIFALRRRRRGHWTTVAEVGLPCPKARFLFRSPGRTIREGAQCWCKRSWDHAHQLLSLSVDPREDCTSAAAEPVGLVLQVGFEPTNDRL